MYLRQELVSFTNVADEKWQATKTKDCEQPLKTHPFIVFLRPVRMAHVRVRDFLHPEHITWDADFIFKEPTRVLDEK